MDKSLWEKAYERKGLDQRVNQERTLELKRKGFFAFTDLWYDFDKYGYELYVNDRDFIALHPINGWFTKLIDDKRFIPIIFRNHPEWLPELSIAIEKHRVRYIIENGKTIDLPNIIGSLEETLNHYISKYGTLFVKPAGLSGARGVFKVTGRIEDYHLAHIHQDHAYLVNNCLENDRYSGVFNNMGINTLRPYFFRNIRTNQLQFLKILHRFGTSMSGIVDNISRGGMACEVNVATGELSQAVAVKHQAMWHDYHLDTNIRISGFKIPDWSNKLNQLSKMLEVVSFLDYGAFDIAPTPTGLKILEINSMAGRDLLQCIEPAFLNNDFREFCLAKGYNVDKGEDGDDNGF